jgi:hypothetical protein
MPLEERLDRDVPRDPSRQTPAAYNRLGPIAGTRVEGNLVKASEIEEQLLNIESSLGNLEASISMTITKLEPILQHHPESKGQAGTSTPIPRSPLGERMSKIRQHIEQLTYTLHCTHERIAI